MIRTLIWKESREHLATAIALVMFAVGLLVYVQYFVPADSGQSIPPFAAVAIALVWLTGLVAGSQAFAGEVENRTMSWLDSLPALRLSIGRTKIIFAALFTLVPAVMMFALGWTLGWIGPEFRGDTAVFMLALGLAGLGCGLVASAFARSALFAIVLAIAIQPLLYGLWYLIAQLVYLFESDRFLRSTYQWSAVICIALPFLIAQRRFTRLDRSRAARVAATAERNGNSWRTLLWLTWRQNRVIAWMILSAGLIATIVLPIGRSMPIWPAIGLLFGIVAGVGVFGVDRAGEAFRFFGDRRVPPGRVWLVKAGFGLAIALAPALMQLAGAYIFTRFKMLDLSLIQMNETLNEFWRSLTLDYVLLGPLYGFALGVLLGLLCRKAFIAVILAAMLGAIVFAGWWPATVVGGVHLWQWPLPPLTLLTLTYLLVRPWATSRLGGWRPALGVCGTVLLAVALMVGGIAYRVIEPPVRTPPFDVAAFEASLPTPEQNESGRKLVNLFRQFRAELDNSTIPAEDRWSWRAVLAIDKGHWPINDTDLNDEMDAFAAGPWLPELRAATALPLGMVDGLRSPLYEMDVQLNVPANMLGRLCVARAMQLAARKQPAQALDSCFLALDFSRQLRNKASHITYQQSASIERTALAQLATLIESAAARPDLLTDALARLTAYDRSVPPMTDTLKLDFLNLSQIGNRGFSHGFAGDEVKLARFAADSPLEALRTRAILDTLLAGYLRTAELAYPEAIRRIEIARRGSYSERWSIGWAWTPPPGSNAAMQAAYRQMEELGENSVFSRNGPYFEWSVLYQDIFMRTARSAGRLQLALALYQLRHARPATTLSELVPEFMPAPPMDPYSEKSFGYRVSSGERLDWNPTGERIDWNPIWDDRNDRYHEIPTGTGIVWSVGGDMVDGGGRINDAFLWHSRNDHPERDRLFLVPRLAKP